MRLLLTQGTRPGLCPFRRSRGSKGASWAGARSLAGPDVCPFLRRTGSRSSQQRTPERPGARSIWPEGAKQESGGLGYTERKGALRVGCHVPAEHPRLVTPLCLGEGPGGELTRQTSSAGEAASSALAGALPLALAPHPGSPLQSSHGPSLPPQRSRRPRGSSPKGPLAWTLPRSAVAVRSLGKAARQTRLRKHLSPSPHLHRSVQAPPWSSCRPPSSEEGPSSQVCAAADGHRALLYHGCSPRSSPSARIKVTKADAEFNSPCHRHFPLQIRNFQTPYEILCATSHGPHVPSQSQEQNRQRLLSAYNRFTLCLPWRRGGSTRQPAGDASGKPRAAAGTHAARRAQRPPHGRPEEHGTLSRRQQRTAPATASPQASAPRQR